MPATNEAQGQLPSVALCIGGGDALDWPKVLHDAGDTHALEHQGRVFLHSPSIDATSSKQDAETVGKELLGNLNGLMAAFHGYEPVEYIGLAELQGSGAYAVTQSLSGTVKTRFRATARLSGGGRPEVLVLADKLSQQPLLADAAYFYGKATGWFELYFAIESLVRYAGTEDQFKKSGWGAGANLGHLKQTANFHRHAYAARPAKEMSWNASYKLTGIALLSAIASSP
ncbi:MAG: hypothetical protein KJ944_08170 [Alphaproteobacteria bacterium]|nr:hypothetical protein [Alphaproteobacteria bacterium]MBU1561438.1 hypothetical protein [Alphaproteobacteria bacterium]MBU2302558.1 hypothetical protein [Alphaproteobacteria bacterium]MBU2367546.1 hypothetical protein [Alphaproteobacteria bacterium]